MLIFTEPFTIVPQLFAVNFKVLPFAAAVPDANVSFPLGASVIPSTVPSGSCVNTMSFETA